MLKRNNLCEMDDIFMKILKDGKAINQSQTLYFICCYCGCEYSCNTNERNCHKKIDNDEYTHDGIFYTYDCPNCNVENIGMTIQEYLERESE